MPPMLRPGVWGVEGSQGPQCLAALPRGPNGWGVGDPTVTQTLRWCGGSGYRVETGQEGAEPRRQVPGEKGCRPRRGGAGRWAGAPVLKRPGWDPSAGVSLQLSPRRRPARPCSATATSPGRSSCWVPGGAAPCRRPESFSRAAGYSPRPGGTSPKGVSPAPPLPLQRPLTWASLPAQC